MPWTRGDELTIPAVLADRVRASADKVCVWFDDRPFTFGELDARSTSAANALQAIGVRPGDAVALFLGSSVEFVDVWLATAKIGAVSVPINTAYAGDFLAHQLRDSRSRAVLVDESTLDRVLKVAPQLPDLQHVFVRSGATPYPRAGWGDAGVTVLDAALLRDADGGVVAGATEVAWNRPASFLYTSGTTGPSKGVVVTQHYLVRAAQIIADAYRLTEADVTYGAVPLFHFSGMLGSVLAAIVAGNSAVVDARFSVSATWDRVRRYGATGIIAVGSMIVMLWNLPRAPSDAQLPIRFLAGAPIPADLHHAIEERYRCSIVTMYGLTEAFPVAVFGVDDVAVPGSAGRLNPSFEVRLFDAADREVPVGEVGEIVCRPLAPHVMFEGYFANPDATQAQMRNLWFHTGDLGRLDADGNLFFVDRKKDAMRRRGENISSFEVEQSVMKHPDVAEAVAHAVPSEVGEDDVKLCVVVKPGAGLTHEALFEHCVQRLPFFAVPRYIEFVPDLPRNAVGRVLKYELRARGVTGTTWDRDTVAHLARR